MPDKDFTQQIYKRDPLYNLLVNRLSVNQTGLTIAIAVLMFVILRTPIILKKSTFDMGGLGIDIVQSFVIFPIAISLYFQTPKFLSRLFTELRLYIDENHLTGGETYDEFLKILTSTLNNYWWIVFEFGLIIYYWIYRLSLKDPSIDITLSINPPEIRTIFRLVLLVIYTPVMYAGILSIYRMIIAAIYTGKLFRTFQIHVNPLCPDGAGGIGIVGQVLIMSLLLATTIGIAGTAMTYFNLSIGNNPFQRFETVALGIIYLVLLPFVFANWLWFPHQALLDAREKVLAPLAEEFKLAAIQNSQLKDETTETIKARTERLTEIKKQYELIRDTFPIWPLQVQPLRNLLATSIMPAVTSLLSGPILQLWKTITAFMNSKP